MAANASISAPASAAKDLCDLPNDIGVPLIVDLDGTLLLTDTLHESFIGLVFQAPLAAIRCFATVTHGRASLKRYVAEHFVPAVEFLPQRAELIALIEREKARGRKIHLVTAADQKIASEVARIIPLFDSATGSDGLFNLKGVNKLQYLKDRFPAGFLYAGDHASDGPLFAASQGAILCDVDSRTESAAVAGGVSVVARLRQPRSKMRSFLRAMRPHQWSKNVLVFVPLMLGHAFNNPAKIAATVLAFLILCCLASATYLVNDLADIEADRQHPTKRNRPFASGSLAIRIGMIAAPLMISAALLATMLLPFGFFLTLVAYLVLTTSYSFRLKQIPLFDVFVVGSLFTLRIVMGVEAIGITHSPWLLSFSLLFFLSLALSKRHAEVMHAAHTNRGELAGRGYLSDDWPVTLCFGIGCGLMSIIIMLLYLANDAAPSGLYPHLAWLYVVPGAITVWIMRIWLLSHRMQLHDDPVVFALTDPASLTLGAVVAVSFWMAL
jgi:4-hydroxybenzoate polyprenyltransferase